MFQWNWKEFLINPDLVADVQQLQAMLENTQVSEAEDRWVWLPDSSREFSVKAARLLIRANVDISDRYIMDWCNWIPAKVNIHLWRTELGKIPTKVTLKNRNVLLDDPVCPLCGSEEETVDHLFIGCHVASVVWNGISVWCKIPNIFAFTVRDLLGIFKELTVSDRKKEAVQGIIMIACWNIWRARNNFVFANKPVKIDKIISEVKALGHFWFSNRSKYKDIEWGDWCSFVNM
ncbi:uncharacterized protein LOC110942918 [Helianthus annuus]|uniref:uncharacterized protein LOC110942918 n=1 Tax=Helianthus annuus TaxID=4232 RepID=UPI000B8F1FF8|nr:uncharacterized protein LOC110942918 [Helianthus annuus]